MKNTKRLTVNTSGPAAVFARQCGFALLVATMLSAAILVVLALVISNINISFTLHQTLTTVGAALSLLFAARFVAKRRQQNGLFLGLITGFLFFFLVFLLSLASPSGALSAQMAVKLAVFVCAGALGGILGVSAATKPRKIKAA